MNVISAEQMELLNEEEVKIIQIIVCVALVGALIFLGIFVNIVNIFVFWKQGLRQTVNISMFAIAISDLGSLVTIAWMNINLNPFMENADLSYEPNDIVYLTGGYPHVCFHQITIWITVYVTAERFVCVALPLKVKQIFTPPRTKVAISLICFLIILTVLPVYIYFEFGEAFNPSRNQTRIALKTRNITPNLTELLFTMYVVIEIMSFVVLTVVTFLLVVALRRRLKWRKTLPANRDQCQVTSRSGTRTMKMVGLVAGVLILCTAPGVVLAIYARIMYGLKPGYQNSTTFSGLWPFALLTDAFSVTVNTVLFYKMSSKYKQHFDAMLCQCTRLCT